MSTFVGLCLLVRRQNGLSEYCAASEVNGVCCCLSSLESGACALETSVAHSDQQVSTVTSRTREFSSAVSCLGCTTESEKNTVAENVERERGKKKERRGREKREYGGKRLAC